MINILEALLGELPDNKEDALKYYLEQKIDDIENTVIGNSHNCDKRIFKRVVEKLEEIKNMIH